MGSDMHYREDDQPEPDADGCTCFWTDPKVWLSAASMGYGSGYEPGSQREWNPECPVHPPTPLATGPMAWLIDRNEIFPTTPEKQMRRMEAIQWQPQPWEHSTDPVLAQAVDEARRALQASLTESLDRQCTSLGLDPYETWRWPHNDEIDRKRYRRMLEWRADEAIARSIVPPWDRTRITTVPF